MSPNVWIDRLLDIVRSPGLWLSVLLAVIYSLIFAAWRWAGWRQVPRDLLAGLLGFAAGQLFGTLVGFTNLRVGLVQLLWGTIGAVAALAAGRRLWRSGQRDQGS